MECAKFPKVLVGSCKNVRSLESGDEPAFNSGGGSLQLWGSKPSTVGEQAFNCGGGSTPKDPNSPLSNNLGELMTRM